MGPSGQAAGAGSGGREEPHQLGPCTPSKEICEAHDIFMCPRGDHSRRYQRLSDTCTFAKVCCPGGPRQAPLARGKARAPPLLRGGEGRLWPCRVHLWGWGVRRREAHPSPCAATSPQLTHLFDNEGTVVFAIFMALWGEWLRAAGGQPRSSPGHV